ncbi:MAG: class I adenylate-forming enzyme family protein [Bacteroidota bacterium]
MTSLSDKILSAQTVHGIAPHDVQYDFSSIAEVLKARAEDERTWMIYYDEQNNRTEYSFKNFVARVCQTAGLLKANGLKRGDRIATAAHNHPDTIVQYFAAWMLGACVVPLNMTEDDARISYILQNSRAKLVFCREDYLARLEALLQSDVLKEKALKIIPVFGDELRDGGFHELLKSSETAEFPKGDFLDDECLIVYTSGTTGNPKGVVLVQRNLFADGTSIAAWHGIDATQRMMCVLPIHHVNGTIVTTVTPFLAGASLVLNRKFQTEYFFKRILDEKVNIVSVVPTLLAFLLEGKADSLDVLKNGFKHIICGAGPLTCELAKQFEDHYGIRIMHGYGLSETTCYSCFLPTELSNEEHRHWMQDFGFPSIGVPIPANEMAIHDENGNSLGEMERGEIVIRGTNVMKEYYENPKANEETFKNGWFRSGDEGFFKKDEQGRDFYFITGRLKELIIRGGVNLAPLEIDEVLARAPGVKAGICVGFVNDFYGEEVGALVIPTNENVLKEEILDFCFKNLAFSKAPKVVIFAENLPVTSTGKYQRNKVKELFKEYQGVQFKKVK